MPYFYIIRTRACINANEQVYKIGKTDDFSKRINGYDKGSIPIYFIYVNNADTFENIMKDLFKIKFNQRVDYGVEYFEGNIKEMLKIISEYIISNQNLLYNNESEISNIEKIYTYEDILIEKDKIVRKLNKLPKKDIYRFKLLFQDISFKYCHLNCFESFRFDIDRFVNINTNKMLFTGSNKLGDICSGSIHNACLSAFKEKNTSVLEFLQTLQKMI